MKNDIAVFEEKGIRRVYDEKAETWYFSVVDIVQVLTDSPDPGAYWRKLKQRLKICWYYIFFKKICYIITMHYAKD